MMHEKTLAVINSLKKTRMNVFRLDKFIILKVLKK